MIIVITLAVLVTFWGMFLKWNIKSNASDHAKSRMLGLLLLLTVGLFLVGASLQNAQDTVEEYFSTNKNLCMIAGHEAATYGSSEYWREVVKVGLSFDFKSEYYVNSGFKSVVCGDGHRLSAADFAK